MAINISDATARNRLNQAMRQELWYQDWFRQRGLNPDMVRLTEAQRKALQALVVSKGFLDPSDGHIDPAGNVSDFHGWKGLPTAAKIAIIGGAAAATAGAAGAFGGGAGAIPTIEGTAIGSGMGTGPASLAGTSALAAGGASAIPTITGTAIGSGMAGAAPSLYGRGSPGAQLGSFGVGDLASAGSRVGSGLASGLADQAPDWLQAVLGGLAGLPGLFANRGPSDEERAYQAQATRLLGQQEQRTQFQNPLYEAITKMAYGLQPKMGTGGQPYPMNSLSDVQVPGLEELIAAQRRT